MVAQSPAGATTLGAMADTHRCPYCELIFPNLVELQSHIALDHPDRRVPERRYERASSTAEPWPNRPWLAVMPTRAPSTWRSPAWPRSCQVTSHT